ncbi:MAG TPA: hypothetical protein VN674_13720 [Gemmatimonadales bacterium]|nr:hypothetical protein [Gemmatimonadales bacterium]
MILRTHAYPVFARVRCKINDVRVAARQDRLGQVVRHEFSHGVVPTYVVDLLRPVVLVNGQRAKRMRFWECQLETTDYGMPHTEGTPCHTT